MQNMRQNKNKRVRNGFTLVELIIVVVILSIAAMIAVPMVSNAADIQVRAAANKIAADIDYVKSLAITHQRRHWVVFNESDESYQIWTVEDDGTTEYVIDHPVNPGPFVVDFSTDGRLSRVNIGSADFDSDSTNTVSFDYLGSPYHGKSTAAGNALNSGQITL